MTAQVASWRGALGALWRLAGLAFLAMLVQLVPAAAQEKAQLIATSERGFARLVLSFPERKNLPPYTVNYENGVLAISFDRAISVLLPDLALALPDYATVGRVDSEGKGIRIGLRGAFNVNRTEAGEALYVDLMPPSWSGTPPPLPASVLAKLAERDRVREQQEAEDRKTAATRAAQPEATVRVGRNPTFLRLQVDWNVDTEARYSFKGTKGTITFDWPIALDLYGLKTDLPAEFRSATNTVTRTGTQIDFAVAEGTVPRFYKLSPTQFVMDVDTSPEAGLAAALALEEEAKQARLNLEIAAREQEERVAARLGLESGTDDSSDIYPVGRATVVPTVTSTGGTIRIAFPFDADTSAAVFRRGDTVWMVFDTAQAMTEPADSPELQSVASSFDLVAAGETKVIRMDLASDRLATMGSEGRSWVLSLGDQLLGATEPLTLSRERDEQGRYHMAADVQRPGKVHVLRDPNVGDTLRVVTVMPPARGLTRTMQYVDFDALRSAHGLVIKPRVDELDVAIEEKLALISSRPGLSLSDVQSSRQLDVGNAPEFRQSFLDLGMFRAADPGVFVDRREDVISRAAAAEGRARDLARLELAQLYVGNEFAYEAIGVLETLEQDLESEDLRKKLRLVKAVADTLAYRPRDALAILNEGTFPEESDALLWRTIAKVDANDFRGARADAIAAEGAAESYPAWVRTKFLFAALRAAAETDDTTLALRLLGKIEFAKLEPEQVSQYQLMQGRIAELEGKPDDAIESYGQVIAADFRPTRAEAVYRTLKLLNETGKIDLQKATETLSAEVLTWRGTPLEAEMQKLLAELYFAHRAYRDGFMAVRDAADSFPDGAVTEELARKAQATFEDLYLNGAADALPDVEALALYYDFRQLTPPGTRGDEMIRNLARRLVKVDLLTQAGDLLQYQVDSRLDGIAKAQVAADLALIRIADRRPEAALDALNKTRLAELPAQLERRRRVLEARALIDAGREELALDIISRLDGRDADVLRVDGYWRSKNYALASELLETMSTVGADGTIGREQRMGLVKAAVGFVLAGDKLGLSRLRAKFSDTLAASAEWPLFEYVTRDIAPQSLEFRRVAQEVAAIDSLDAFLTSYRDIYGNVEGVVPGRPVQVGGAA
jgi:hypothetical protein